MKNLTRISFMSLLMGGLLFVTSCGKDDEPAVDLTPSLIVTTTPSANSDGVIELEVGAELTISVTASTPAGFNTVRISDGINTDEQTRNDLGLDATATSASATFIITIDGDAGDTSAITVTVVDEAGETAIEGLTIELFFTGTPITAENVVLLAAPTDDAGVKSSDTFYSTNLNTIYSMDDVLGTSDPVSADIDFGYYYGTTNKASLTSISNYGFEYGQAAWGTQNTTLFRTTTLDAAGFDAITTEEELVTEFEVGSGEADQGIDLAVGDVIAFKTDTDKTNGGKFGLIKIVGITGTNGSDGKIDIEVLVEQ